MKFLNQNKKAIVLPILLIGLSLICSDVIAKHIKRSCKANYSGIVQGITFDSKTVGIPYNVVYISGIGGTFSAEASCGSLVPNRCRKRARNKLLACVRAQVNSPTQLPQACQPNLIKNYPGANLLSMLKTKACSSQLRTVDMVSLRKFFPSQYQLKVLVKIHIEGNTDCGTRSPGMVTIDGQHYKVQGNEIFIIEPLKSFTVSCP